MNPFVSSVAEAARSVLDRGYGVICAGGLVRGCLDEIFDDADRFFACDLAEKSAFSAPEISEGYRRLGPGLPGGGCRSALVETFAFAQRNQSAAEISAWQSRNALHNSMKRIAPFHSMAASMILGDIWSASRSGERRVIDATESSFLRLDCRRADPKGDEILQEWDEHADLLTIVSSRDPGLELRVDDQILSMSPRPDELLVIPGRALACLTGGRVRAAAHQVRNIAHLRKHSSLRYVAEPRASNLFGAWPPSVRIVPLDGHTPAARQGRVHASRQ